MTQEIGDLNKAMRSAGIIVFVAGLMPPGSAKSIRIQANGEMHIKQGLYLDSNEHVGGFWVVETHGLDEASSWGKKQRLLVEHLLKYDRFIPEPESAKYQR